MNIKIFEAYRNLIERSQAFNQLAFIVLCWITAVLLLGTYGFSATLIKPVKQLTTAANVLAQGKFDTTIDVLQSKGLAKKIPVIGQDADAAGIRAIRAGKQLATIYKPIDSLAKEAVTIALQMAKGEQIQATRYIDNGKTLIPSILLTPIVVDKDNIGVVHK
ncbi:substrate-binding domain-containing protein [Kurthia massiliensis]|uniref:substrate-binding domain-containing protein n=1 Tax=Kurthia massiliensis TaxID=1033739 RepID=UPI00028948D8|nr:substrate-binding domain-containing protein [Kurthia massiliensis]